MVNFPGTGNPNLDKIHASLVFDPSVVESAPGIAFVSCYTNNHDSVIATS